jgi:sugar (pentulose or hexulose) kinase
VRYGIAVLDIGKTNKKFVLFNEDLEPVEIRKTNIETYRSPDGFDLEDVETIEQWMLEELKRAAQQYPVRMISISTHGASVVCVGKTESRLFLPCLYERGSGERSSGVFRLFGPREQLQKETATAEVRPLINVGKLLFFVSQSIPKSFSEFVISFSTRSILRFALPEFPLQSIPM